MIYHIYLFVKSSSADGLSMKRKNADHPLGAKQRPRPLLAYSGSVVAGGLLVSL